jgi:hypothetical protein
VARAEDYFFLGDARPNVQGLQAPEAFAVVRHRHHTWAQENGRDVDCRLDALPAYHKTFADVVGPEAMAFYEHARRALFVDAAAAPAPPA